MKGEQGGKEQNRGYHPGRGTRKDKSGQNGKPCISSKEETAMPTKKEKNVRRTWWRKKSANGS